MNKIFRAYLFILLLPAGLSAGELYSITGSLSKLNDSLPFSTGSFPVKDSATVLVKLSNVHNYPVFFPYNIGEKWFRDSSYTMRDGYRVYKLRVTGSRLQWIYIKNPAMNIILPDGFIPGPQPVFLLKEGSTIVIEGDAEIPLLVNIKSSDKDVVNYEFYRSGARTIEAERWEVLKKVYADTTNKIQEKSLKAEIEILDSSLHAWQTEFVKKYSTSYAALEVFATYYYKLENREALSRFAKFPEEIRSSSLGKKVRSQLDAISLTSEARPVIPFKQKGVDGKMVDIGALKGKVVIIDFWGSWCGPCRESHPHLKELYKKYKAKGLEIVGVAYENGKKQAQDQIWRKAIADDGMTWLNILNDPEQKDIVKMYGVNVFPTKLVTDRKGNIVLRHVGESAEALDEKLKELFP